jgi:hypothetical protein
MYKNHFLHLLVVTFFEEISLYSTENLMSSQRSKYCTTDPSPEPDETTSDFHIFNKVSFVRQPLLDELFYLFIFNLRTAAFKAYCAIWAR